MKKLLLFIVGILLSQAWTVRAVGSLADVTVYDRSERRTLPVYPHDGKYYVVGRPGNRYQITLRSHAGDDMLAVTSVDGVNVVSGETAAWGQSGYVLAPGQATDVKGWRKSLQRVAQFYFTPIGDSYAARTGRPENVGVIGVALFRRKVEPIAVEPYWEDSDREPAPPRAESAPAPWTVQPGERAKAAPPAGASSSVEQSRRDAHSYQPDNKIGTGHGKSETSQVRYVDFERASDSPDEVITIYYDSYRNLVAQGVIPHERPPYTATPFPGQFVPDPPRVH